VISANAQHVDPSIVPLLEKEKWTAVDRQKIRDELQRLVNYFGTNPDVCPPLLPTGNEPAPLPSSTQFDRRLNQMTQLLNVLSEKC